MINGLAHDIKVLAQELKFKKTILSYSLKDKFFHTYEKQQDMLDLHGINKSKIVKDIIKKS